MPTYTADAVALLVYLVDALPRRADRIFAEAEAGETIVQAPSTALAEVLYSVSRDRTVRGVALQATPEDVRRALVADGPVSIARVGEDELVEYAAVVDEFSIHDALIVSSHRARGTDAVVTSDGAIADADVDTTWE